MQQHGGAADLAEHVIPAWVGVHQVADHQALVGLPHQVLFELANSPV
jgi:hypothetical protein